MTLSFHDRLMYPIIRQLGREILLPSGLSKQPWTHQAPPHLTHLPKIARPELLLVPGTFQSVLAGSRGAIVVGVRARNQ